MRRAALLAVLIATGALAACNRAEAPAAASNFPTVRLNDAVSDQLGGPDTCVVMLDAATGAALYQYGAPSVCNRALPPCATADIAMGLAGLDAGVVQPGTVFKWNGQPQPVSAWEKDADMTTAFRQSMGWWFQALAARLGPGAVAEALKAYDYGAMRDGVLAISTRDQAGFLQRLAAGRLSVKPASAQAVQGMMADETQDAAAVIGRHGSCDTQPDGSRSVGWWVGRLTSPDRDLVFAASIEGQNAFPGFEVASRMKTALAAAGLWPAA